MYTNRVFPRSNHFPWVELRDFVEEHKAVLPPDIYTQINLDVVDEADDPPVYRAETAISRSKNGITDIYSEIKTPDVSSVMVLDLSTQTGEMEIPEYGVNVELSGDEFSIKTNFNAHPDACIYARNYLRLHQKVLGFIAKDRKMIEPGFKGLRFWENN